MERDAALAVLKAHEAELRQLGVLRCYLFRSTARGDARDDSDVDLFFDYQRGAFGLWGLMDVADTANRIPGRKADIMTRLTQPGDPHITRRRQSAVSPAST